MLVQSDGHTDEERLRKEKLVNEEHMQLIWRLRDTKGWEIYL